MSQKTEKEELISRIKTLCDLTSTEDLPRQIRNASHEARLLLAKLEAENEN